jgi:hypothetical protein
MRLTPLLFAVAAVAWSWCAEAQTEGEGDPGAVALDHFQAQLQEQCPDKQLQLLSARDLRDGLDDYKDGLEPDLHDRLQQAEQTRCSTLDAGAACVNLADLVAADQMGRIDDVAHAICTTFLRCHDQGVCDYAR